MEGAATGADLYKEVKNMLQSVQNIESTVGAPCMAWRNGGMSSLIIIDGKNNGSD
jgi:hypothetical protein